MKRPVPTPETLHARQATERSARAVEVTHS